MMLLAWISAAELRHSLTPQIGYLRKPHVFEALSGLGREDSGSIGEELMETTVRNLRQSPVCSQKVANVCWQPGELRARLRELVGLYVGPALPVPIKVCPIDNTFKSVECQLRFGCFRKRRFHQPEGRRDTRPQFKLP